MKFFRRLFKEKLFSASNRIETAPLTEKQIKEVTQKWLNIKPPQIQVGCSQSVGKYRDHNEDTLYALQTILLNKDTDIPLGLFIIADGMGGHQYGDIASDVATKTVAKRITSEIISLQQGMGPEDLSLHEMLEDSVLEAHNEVLAAAPGGGTTLTVLFMMGEQVNVAHVGDSRVYFFYMDGRIDVITKDHSLVHRLIELGQITQEEAAIHPQRNVLYKAIGQGDPIKPDITTLKVPKPGYILLCSDGLWGLVNEQEMFRIIKSEENLPKACNNLVEAANNNGGPDNISVILIRYLE